MFQGQKIEMISIIIMKMLWLGYRNSGKETGIIHMNNGCKVRFIFHFLEMTIDWRKNDLLSEKKYFKCWET